MGYRVVLADSAKSDADNIYQWVVVEAPVRGPAWFEELLASLYSLEKFPRRGPLAREATKIGRKIRCHLFGRRKHVYRILYEIDEAAKVVNVLHIRHGARRDLDPSDFVSL